MIYGHNRRYLFIGDPVQMTLSQQAVETALLRMHQAKVTDLLLIVTNGRGAVWYQPEVSVADTTSNQSWDALSYWITRAHELGMRCHAWFNVSLRQTSFTGYPEFSPEGTPAGKYNLWLPACRDWLASCVKEVMGRYAWDGIQFDYMRTGGLWEGPDAEALYAIETGRTYQADRPVWSISPGNSNGGIQITNWIKQATQDCLDQMLTVVPPACEVSTFGVGWFIEYPQGRRINEWLADGRVDVAFSAHYGEVANMADIAKTYAGVQKGQRMGVAFSLYKDDLSGPQAGTQVWANLRKHRALYSGADQALYVYQGGASIYLTDDQISWLSRN